MLYRPPARVHAGFPRSDLMSSVALGRALSTVRLFSTGVGCTGSTLPEDFGLPKSDANTFLVKLLSPPKLGYLNDGSIMPSIHSLLREHFTIATRVKLLPLRTRSFLASHPASWIDVQSLPRGCRFPMPVRWGRICTFHHQISCLKVSFYPSIPEFNSPFRTNVSHSST